MLTNTISNIMQKLYLRPYSHRVGGIENVQNISTNVDQKSLETEFSIAICRPTGDKWQSKTLFLANFDPRSSIAKSVFDCRLPCVILMSNFQSFVSSFNLFPYWFNKFCIQRAHRSNFLVMIEDRVEQTVLFAAFHLIWGFGVVGARGVAHIRYP